MAYRYGRASCPHSRRAASAAEAQRLFTEATKHQLFEDEISASCAICGIDDLGIMASNILRRLFEHAFTAIIPLYDKTGEDKDALIVLEALSVVAIARSVLSGFGVS